MSDAFTPDELGSTPTIEVLAYRDGELVHRELCETDADASAVVEQWSQLDGVVCQVDDLSVHHRPTDVLEPTESVPADDDLMA